MWYGYKCEISARFFVAAYGMEGCFFLGGARECEEVKSRKYKKKAVWICVSQRIVVPLCAFSWSGHSVPVREQKNEGTSAIPSPLFTGG